MCHIPMRQARRRDPSRKDHRYCLHGKHTYLLAKARFSILAFGSMDESGGFCVETVQTVGVLVDKSVVLGHKLPADLGGNDTGASRVRVGLSAHDTIQMRYKRCDRSRQTGERDDDARESEWDWRRIKSDLDSDLKASDGRIRPESYR